MGLQVVSMVEFGIANETLMTGHFSAFVSGVPPQRILVFVPFAAHIASPCGIHFWIKKKKSQIMITLRVIE